MITESIYDDAGRIIATRIGTDPWTCKTYDVRGRVLTNSIPALANTANVTRSARTVTYNYAFNGNSLVSSITDSSGAVTTTVDLLGRTVSYSDTVAGQGTVTTSYTYNSLGQMTGRNGQGNETYTYDNYNRLSSQSVNGYTVATPSYDTYSRLQGVTYNATSTTNPMTSTISKDSLGRENGLTYLGLSQTPNLLA